MLLLADWLKNWLPGQPEYGMGYQKVVATLNTGSVENGIIVNSQVFLRRSEAPWQMLFDDWNLVLKEAATSSLSVTSVQLIARSAESLRGVRQIAVNQEKYARLANSRRLAANSAYGSVKAKLLEESTNFSALSASAAAKDAPITLTDENEQFKRFSAYTDDKRVTKEKGLTAGTFATTKEDADANVKTGADAISRYALENKKPASNVFTISPAKDTDLQRGTVQPAYGEPGGGVEVIFVNGTAAGTVSGPKVIADK